MSDQAAGLRAIRARHGKASLEWMFEIRDGKTVLTANDVGAIGPVATLIDAHNPADAEFLASAHADVAFLLDFLDRAFAEIRNLKGSKDAGDVIKKDYTTEAAIWCSKEPAQKFLVEMHGGLKLGPDMPEKDRITAAHVCLRLVLKISSKKELNKFPDAAQRWRDLRNQFNEWMKMQ